MSSTVAPIEGDAPAPRRHARMERYAWWQLRDYFMDRGIPTLIVIALFGALQVVPMLASLRSAQEKGLPRGMVARYGGVDAALAAMKHDMGVGFLRGFLGIVVYLGALFAIQGLVSNDRAKGFFRFLFAKPVTPMRYYGQAFALHGAGYLLLVTLAAAVFGAYVFPVLDVRFLAAMACMWLLYAGITFLFSSLAKLDWLFLVAMTLVATIAWSKWKDSASPLARLLYLLPPLHRTNEVYDAMATAQPLPWPLIRWFAAYGLVCFIAALVVLRRRRLGIP